MFMKCYSLQRIYAASDSASNLSHNWTVKEKGTAPMEAFSVFAFCENLRGGIPYTAGKTSSEYAKIIDGYFTDIADKKYKE